MHRLMFLRLCHNDIGGRKDHGGHKDLSGIKLTGPPSQQRRRKEARGVEEDRGGAL